MTTEMSEHREGLLRKIMARHATAVPVAEPTFKRCGSVTNEVFLVKDKESDEPRCLIKLDVKLKKMLPNEHSILQHVSKYGNGIRIPHPLCPLESMDGISYLILEAFRGEKLGLLKAADDSLRRAYRETGALLNALHRLPSPQGVDAESLLPFLKDRRRDLQAIESEYGVPTRSRFEGVLDLLATPGPGTDSVFAHRDFNTDQVLALENGTVTAFIDWERAGPGSRLRELGNFIMHIQFREHFGMEMPFLDGYLSGNSDLSKKALAMGALYCWTEGAARSHIDRALKVAGF